MNAYFFADISQKKAPPLEFITITETLRELDISPISNIEDPNEWDIHNDVVKKIKNNGQTLLSKIDMLIIEATNQHPEVSYLIAQAAMYKKPTLCLYKHGRQRHITLNHLSKQPNLTFLQIQPYTTKSLPQVILKFLKNTKAVHIQDNIPSIKFTLRISSRIERYLAWKAKQEKTTKARFLRNKIERDIEKDYQYQKYLEEHV